MTAERFDCTDELLDDGVRVFHLHGRLHNTSACFGFQERACLAIKDSAGGVVLAAAQPAVERLLDAIWFLKIVDHAPTVEDGVARVRTC